MAQRRKAREFRSGKRQRNDDTPADGAVNGERVAPTSRWGERVDRQNAVTRMKA